MTPAEAAFRETERRLDELLRRDVESLRRRDISVCDDSGREYHYKNDHLSWSLRFEARRQRGSEIEKITVVLSFTEDDAMSVRVWTRAEIFQIGQTSRWKSEEQSTMSVPHLEDAGLGATVLASIEKGQRLAE